MQEIFKGGKILRMSKYIITADWHLRNDKPRCRLDLDWIKSQKRILYFIRDLMDTYQAQLLISGDIFHKSRVPSIIESMFLSIFNNYIKELFIIPGQHDMPEHNLSNLELSSFNVLLSAGYSYPNNSKIDYVFFGEDKPQLHNNENILLIHETVVEVGSTLERVAKNTITASVLLDKYPNYKYIIAGDIHRGFIHKSRDQRYVIVPGCINRQASDFIDYSPHVILLDTDTEELIIIDIPDDVSMITTEITDIEKEKDERISAFVELIKETGQISLDFIENLKNSIKVSELDSLVKDVLTNLIDEVKND